MKTAIILNYEIGEVIIHHYNEDDIGNDDIESYLINKGLYSFSSCSFMCVDKLIINTEE
jgi:hypothetical protein